MTEWGVVGVIVVLVGLFTAVCVPLIKSTKEQTQIMTELNISVKNLSDDITELSNNNKEAHKRLWDHQEEQDKMINNHETRIVILEKEGVKK